MPTSCKTSSGERGASCSRVSPRKIVSQVSLMIASKRPCLPPKRAYSVCRDPPERAITSSSVASAKPFFSNTCLAAAKKASRRAARRLRGGVAAKATSEGVIFRSQPSELHPRPLDMYCTRQYVKPDPKEFAMGIVGFALRYRHTFYVLALMMLFLGGSAIHTTPKDIFPNINIPVVTVIWQYTGLTPEEMEQRVTTYSEYS